MPVRHDLIDTTPQALDIAIPRARIPAGSRLIAWHLCDAATFDLGRSKTAIQGTEPHIWIYSPERCSDVPCASPYR